MFVTMLRERGLEYTNDPVTVALARTGVSAVMNPHHRVAPRCLSRTEAQAMMRREPDWILASDGHRIVAVVRGDRLEATLADAPPETSEGSSDSLDLSAPTIAESGFATVRLQATLREALAALDREESQVVLVSKTTIAMRDGVLGVLTRDQIESSVRYQGNKR